MQNWTDIQARVTAWAIDQFGRAPDWNMITGVIEEIVAEFPEALDESERHDAISDATIFSLNLCGNNDWSFDQIVAEVERDIAAGHMIVWRHNKNVALPIGHFPDWIDAAKACARMGRCALKQEQRIRGFDNPDVYRAEVRKNLRVMVGFCAGQCGSWLEYMLVVAAVAEKVTRRDWKNHPHDAHELAQ